MELNNLSGEIVRNWQSLGRRLGVTEGTIDDITVDNVSFLTPKQKAFGVLRIWRDKDSSSTYRQLAQALKDEGLGRLAEQYCSQQVVCIYFSSSSADLLESVKLSNV